MLMCLEIPIFTAGEICISGLRSSIEEKMTHAQSSLVHSTIRF
ncbi:hypothetical protein MUK42_28466 [Musa troglodytarum]|uniref:Uncharacterized protein n=1 Tax=Musa troglodytarum TaxID=320322 RepID=A0A9E7JSV2_9LILI|nr:hypothetical protein MUK42_28466 [Musa troglodytarum]